MLNNLAAKFDKNLNNLKILELGFEGYIYINSLKCYYI